MTLTKLIKVAERLENPDHPLLGPNLKGLYWFGLWQYGTKFRNRLFIFIHICSIVFVLSEFVELYCTRKDLANVLLNISVTALSLVSICKTLFFLSMHDQWEELVKKISDEEKAAILKQDPFTLTVMEEYTKYCRVITYLYWSVTLFTNIITILTPALKYVSGPVYREGIKNGTEPYPQILSSWFPFNKNQMPGYTVCVLVHAFFTSQGAGVIAVYDTNAVTVMSFLRGQVMIIKDKCSKVFGEDDEIPKEEVYRRIKECHRHHNFVIDVFQLFNSVLSPVMFIYVLVCSITMCCSVVQLTWDDVAMSHKLWVVEYAIAQTFQLFVYCWHSNEIALQTNEVNGGIFKSNWWRSDVRERKLLLLLTGKLSPQYILDAGPFSNLSVPTFIDILKGTYSFYTLFSEMQ